MMKEEANYKEIKQNHKLSSKPMHELYKGLNQRVDLHKTRVTGMGGHQMKDSDRFNK